MTAIKWTEKYRPRDLSEVLGNGKAISDLQSWAQSWVVGVPEKRAVILYGPAGVGKTSAALALARELGWDQIEMNASDDRTARAIDKVAGSASNMRTFSGKKRLVILDEADNLYGRVDRGGTAAMLKLVKSAKQPTVLIANEYYDISKPLRDACLGIQFRSIRKSTVALVLKSICKAEAAGCTPEMIVEIAENAGGDLRSAVNDLQAALEGVEVGDVGEVVTGERDSKSSIFEGLARILRGSNPSEALRITYSLDESPEDLVHWIDENLPLVYEKDDLVRGFDCLSRADVFLGRVRRRQNYGLWRHASFMMTAAVLAVRQKKRGGYIAFRPPSLWRRMGQTKAARNIRDSAALKIGRHCHVSARVARSELMGFFGLLLKDKDLAPKVAALLDFNREEIALLMGTKSTTKKVSRIFEEAQRLTEDERIADIELGWGGFKSVGKKASGDVPNDSEPSDKKVSSKPSRSAQANNETGEVASQKSLFDF